MRMWLMLTKVERAGQKKYFAIIRENSCPEPLDGEQKVFSFCADGANADLLKEQLISRAKNRAKVLDIQEFESENQTDTGGPNDRISDYY